MPPTRRVPKQLTTGPFRADAALAVIGRGQLRGQSYRRMTRGVYQEAGAARGYPEKIRVMRLLLPHDAVLGGLAAAWAHGVHLARVADPVEFICAPGRVRQRPGLLLRADSLRADEIVMTPFGPATSPARTAFDLARHASLSRAAAQGLITRLARGDVRLDQQAPAGPAIFGFPQLRQLQGEFPETVSHRLVTAVSGVDAVLRAASLGLQALGDQVARHPGARGAWSARVVLAMADPRAESPPESVLRARLVLAGLPPPQPQYEIFDENGVFVARPDLGWPEFLLGGEYDGVYHDLRPQIRLDRKRDVRGHKANWRLAHFDSADLRDVPTLVQDVHSIMLQQQARA